MKGGKGRRNKEDTRKDDKGQRVRRQKPWLSYKKPLQQKKGEFTFYHLGIEGFRTLETKKK